MKENKHGVLKGLLIAGGVVASIVGALAILFQVFSKRFKISIEIGPDAHEDDDECPCDECQKDDEIEFDDGGADKAETQDTKTEETAEEEK